MSADAGFRKHGVASNKNVEVQSNDSKKLQLTPVDTPVRGVLNVYKANEGFSQILLYFSYIRRVDPVIALPQLCATMSSKNTGGIL